MVLHCPAYEEERTRLRCQLEKYSVHTQWTMMDLSDSTLFALVFGAQPMPSTQKQRKVAISYCRHFLTMALRRRQRLLAALPKPKKAKAEVVDVNCSSLQLIESKRPVDGLVVQEKEVNVNDISNTIVSFLL